LVLSSSCHENRLLHPEKDSSHPDSIDCDGQFADNGSGAALGATRATRCGRGYDQAVASTMPYDPVCTMDVPCTSETHDARPAIRAQAEIRAVLAALQDLSVPAEVGVGAESAPLPRGDRYTRVRLHARGGLGQVWLGRERAFRSVTAGPLATSAPRGARPVLVEWGALERPRGAARPITARRGLVRDSLDR
jgi:hypothetical protein